MDRAAREITVALVHGAFADSSSWNGVIDRLRANRATATAIPNPLRGLEQDVAYVSSALGQIPGPVLAVGHSYGGAVITNAASNAENVVGLVYVAAFAPADGESLMDVEADSTDSVLNSVLLPAQYPTPQGSETEFRIDPARFRDAFASDVDERDAAVMADTQRPASALAFSQPSGPPAWTFLPTWSIVATGDRAAGTDVVRSMAERAKAAITEVDGSHVIMVSQPQVVADVVMRALASVSR